MSDPPRLLEVEDGLTELERHLLSAGRDAGPQPRVVADVWASVAARVSDPSGAPDLSVAPGGPEAAIGGASAASSGLGAVAAKFLVLGALAGGVAAGGAVWAQDQLAPETEGPLGERAPSGSPAALRDEVETRAPIARAAEGTERSHGVAVASPSPRDPSASSPTRAPAPLGAAEARDVTGRDVTATELPAGRATYPEDRAPRVDPLQAEARAVAEARDALRAGDTRRALSILEQARVRFPSGILVQEREALSIEALAASGDAGRARHHARRFLSMHPESPHAARVRAFAR